LESFGATMPTQIMAFTRIAGTRSPSRAEKTLERSWFSSRSLSLSPRTSAGMHLSATSRICGTCRREENGL
jgi:hypothetical protein